MENLPLLIYVVEVATNLAETIGVVSILTLVVFVSVLIFTLIGCDMNYGKEKEKAEDFLKKTLGWGKKLTVFWVFSLLLITFVPSKQMIYTIIGIDIGIKAMQSEQGQEITGGNC